MVRYRRERHSENTDAEKDDASDESEEEPVLGLDSQDDSAETK